MTELFKRGIHLEQNKEPALSAEPYVLTDEALSEKIPGFKGYSKIEDVTPEGIIDCCKKAGIVDERDGCMLYEKLEHIKKNSKKVRIFIDCIDDQPYVSSSMVALIHFKDMLLGGMELMEKATGVSDIKVATYIKKSECYTKIPRKLGDYPVIRLEGKYPAEIVYEAENALDKEFVNVYVGSAGLLHLYRAVYFGEIQTTAFVTVAGNCIENPRNIEVTLGTPISDLLDRCVLKDIPTRVVVGGSLNGKAVTDTDRAVVKINTKAVIVVKENERNNNFKCIRCGRCADVCPARLNPMLIYRGIVAGIPEAEMQQLGYDQCIQCMCCSYVCPAELNIAASIDLYRKGSGENET